MIFVNFKTFQETTGEKAINLAQMLSEVAHETQVKVIPVVAASDVKEIANSLNLEVWVQKVDPVSFGAHTGSILAEAVIEDGAVGTFLNHSEAKLASFEELTLAFDHAKEAGLKTLIFAKNLEELKNILSLKPTYVAYEPPELIGNTSTSVVKAEPEIISKAVELTKLGGIPLIVGAGIHSQEDVRKSIELGASGVAVATDIVKADNPKKELLDLIEGFN